MSDTALATAVRVRPILFSSPMVRALLGGTKTQTRRVVKPQPRFVPDCAIVWPSGNWQWRLMGGSEPACAPQFRCPYGAPGDRLWIRETFRSRRSRSAPLEDGGSGTR